MPFSSNGGKLKFSFLSNLRLTVFLGTSLVCFLFAHTDLCFIYFASTEDAENLQANTYITFPFSSPDQQLSLDHCKVALVMPCFIFIMQYWSPVPKTSLIPNSAKIIHISSFRFRCLVINQKKRRGRENSRLKQFFSCINHKSDTICRYLNYW